MKKILYLAFVILSLCVASLLELQMVYASPYTSINVGIGYDMITNGSLPDLVVLDVRTQSEYDSGHIYGAVWIPVSELEARIGELAGHENHEIIVYCLSGGRSVTASGILDSHNFTKVYNMLGGISAWQVAGYPIWIATVHNVNTTFNYDTIQAAIDAPQTLDGHRILVDAGTYYEHLVVNKIVSLIGENRSTTVIDGNGTGIVVRSNASDIEIRGFMIQNGGELSGVLIGGYCVNNTIRDNMMRNNAYGVTLIGSEGCSVINNVIRGNSWAGIQIKNGSDNNIYENTIINNSWGLEILTESAFNNTFYHNNFIDNLYQVQSFAFTTRWDNGAEGNFWSDYTGEDLDSNGIGDTSYTVLYGTDYYPLMKPFGDDAPPVADAGQDQTIFQGMTLTFNGNGSYDDVAIKSHVWTFSDVTPNILMGIQPQYIFNDAGDFEVTLNVTDYAGKWDTDTTWIQVLSDTTKPSIDPVSQEPQVPDEGEKVTIAVNVTDEGSGVHNVTLWYTTNEGVAWTDVPMNKTTGDTYVGEIWGLPAGTNVRYNITAYDKAGNFRVDDNAGQLYVYTVILEFPKGASTLLILTVLTVAIAIYKRIYSKH